MKAAIKRTEVGLALVAGVAAAGAGTVGVYVRTVIVVAHQQVGHAKINPAMRQCCL